MRLDRLEIAGFFHFAAPAVVDLRDLPDGLIALVGPNGHGKTRFLDAGLASLYGPDGGPGAFPSRAKRLADYATSRAAYIESHWSLAGEGSYVARVNVDGVRRTTDAVLQQVLPDGRRVPVSDGKASTFRTAVEARFPSRRSMLCSAMATQNKSGSFVELGQKERLELFAELADLGHYAVRAKTAQRCAEVATEIVAQLTTAHGVLSAETSDAVEAQLQQTASDLRAQQAQAEQRHADAHRAVERMETDRATLAAAAVEYAAAEAAAHGHSSRLKGIAREQTVLDDKVQFAQAELDRLLADRDTRIAGNHLLMTQADDVRRQAAAQQADETALTAYRVRLMELKEQRAELERVRATLLRDQDQSETDRRRLRDIEEQAAIATTVPCHGEGPYAACQFLSRAVAAKTGLQHVDRFQLDRTAEDIAAGLTTLQINWDTLAEQLAATTAPPTHDYPLAKYVTELALVEQRVATYRQEQTDARARHAALAAEIAETRDRLAFEATQTQSLLDVAQATVERTRSARQRLDALDAALPGARHGVTSAERELARLAVQQEQVALDHVTLTRKRAIVAQVAARRQTAETEALAWQTLAKACGRDGLPKLEIDAAGPTVSSYCNTLLEGAFGSRFVLDVVTQLPTADGKGVKEGFTIQVLDNEHGAEPRDIADLSGGERVIVEEALRAALACYVNSRHRQPVRTLWRDETTGALDAANAPRYVAMLRTLQQLSGAQQILFVTHTPECQALADAQIQVYQGQPTIALPPYQEGA